MAASKRLQKVNIVGKMWQETENWSYVQQIVPWFCMYITLLRWLNRFLEKYFQIRCWSIVSTLVLISNLLMLQNCYCKIDEGSCRRIFFDSFLIFFHHYSTGIGWFKIVKFEIVQRHSSGWIKHFIMDGTYNSGKSFFRSWMRHLKLKGMRGNMFHLQIEIWQKVIVLLLPIWFNKWHWKSCWLFYW